MANELDVWTLDEVFPLLDEQPADSTGERFHYVFAWKLLERHVGHRPFSSHWMLNWATMGACEIVCIQAAEALAFDSEVIPARSFEAMSLLIRLDVTSVQSSRTRKAIKELLSISPQDHSDCHLKAELIASALLSDKVWRSCRREIRVALSEVCTQNRRSIPGPITTRASCKRALRTILPARL